MTSGRGDGGARRPGTPPNGAARRAGCLLRQRDDGANPLLREEWRAFEGASRGALMAALQQHLPPSLMIPERRLEALLEQALLAQVGLG